MSSQASAALGRPPTLSGILRALLQADLTVQLRNGRALVLTFLPPLALLYGLSAVRDRELGVFQRLRVTPAPTWTIMVSRLSVQIVSMLAMAVVVLVAAAVIENVSLGPAAYLLTLLAVIFSSAVFLGVGQALVGLIKSADTVNAVGRLSYLPLFALGLFAHSTIFGTTFETIARWSPGGAVATLLAGAMRPAAWSGDTWWALLASVLYTVVFAGIGIRWFQWSTR